MRRIHVATLAGAALLLTMLEPALMGAIVTPKNGNLTVSFTDVVYGGGIEPKVERAYNSKSAFAGIFGAGWGWEYEVYLSVLGDGAVVVHEYGGGADNFFSPPDPSPRDLAVEIEQLGRAARESGAAQTSEALNGYEARLQTDAEFRSDEWDKYVKAGRVPRRTLPEGTRLSSLRFGHEFLLKTREGYTRDLGGRLTQTFDEAGKLIRIADRDGNWMSFSHDTAGRPTLLRDNLGRALRFAFNAQGLVVSVTRDDGKSATYRHNSRRELIYSRDVEDNVYTYAYDARHNLTRIGYADSTTMLVTYYPRSEQENVRSVKDRDGRVTRYSYDVDPADSLHLTVTTVVTPTDGEVLLRGSYEYYSARKPTGEEWTRRMVTSFDGDRTETEYNECCNLPVRIVRGQDTTTFEYDAAGRATRKETPDRIDSLAYDPQLGKVTRAVRITKADTTRTWSTFVYDSESHLLSASNSAGDTVRLRYDERGRISVMTDRGEEIDFTYNQQSKPIEIRHSTLGTITVRYDADGNVLGTESTGGPEVARKVTETFSRLLDIIRPVGVTLSP